ncbi:MAG: metalloregulator ArsR/SmtB family transcription factor [Chloroflexi bacterium]|nr:metalloregulator ArsR/SmtB family transcription factor [Chloroflexota bacterium]MCI0574626.1 metalloregulator ArsR/SmtB family transcription factor [Chloroflexota bacterium]MCI0644022.1 metalloregulator ArsR/SmtB family transcription factor [Chloroflexota bacterium]MCI0731696.1 metalloregulator ArsR/SmtB family transcription factor [Chloroflexota bacterium]
MTEHQFNELLQFFKVLGNESRLKILGLLANQERSVGELADLLGVREPTVSHHLAMMKELGLVEFRAERNTHIYWLDTSALEKMSKDIFSKSGLAELVQEQAEVDQEDKVLQTFLDGRRIKEIPARYQKRRIVLQWLVEQFESGRRYTEPEINALLKQYHPDHASLRRYLIDMGLMQRESGFYWRVAESS